MSVDDSTSRGVAPQDSTARLLRPLLWVSIPLTLLWFAVSNGRVGNPAVWSTVVLALLLCELGALVALHFERTTLAGAILTPAAWVTVSVGALIDGGVESPAFMAYAAVVAIAAIGVGPRAAVLAALASVAAGGVMAMYADALRQSALEPHAGVAWLAGTTSLLVAGLSFYALRRVSRDAATSYADLLHASLEEGERLRSYESRFELAPDAVYLHDLTGRFIDGNRAAEKLVGAPRDEFVGKSFLDLGLLAKRDLPRVLLWMARSAAGRPTGPDELQLRRPDGTSRTVEVRSFPVTHLGRRAVLGVARDVTVRRGLQDRLLLHEQELDRLVQERTDELAQANERLRESEALARDSEQQYRRVFEGAHDAIVIFEPDSERILEANAQACEIYGFMREELVGLSLRELSVDVPLGAAQIRKTLETGELQSFETTQRRKDGTPLYLEVNASLVEFKGQQAILSINRDTTERRRAQAQLFARDEELRQAQKMEALGRLASGVAHDFNNLLTAISSFSHLAMDSLDERHPAREDIEQIQAAGDRAARLTKTLLALARKQVLNRRRVDLVALVEELRRMLRRVVPARIDIDVQASESTWSVHADPGQLEQVLLNLAVNARDAMPAGGTLSLATRNVALGANEVASLSAGEYVVLTVRDTGTGVAPDVLPHVFEPFFTTKAVGEGTGLGLATVYGIVQQSGGHIDVSSRLGEGTHFDVYLPASRDATDVPTTAVTQDAPAPAVLCTVLVVDDDDQAREAAAQLLRRSGHSVHIARNAGEALLLAERQPGIDVVLTDVHMPLMDGPELAGRLEQLRPGVPIVYVSGNLGDLDEQTRQRVKPLLRKPYEPAALLQAILVAATRRR